MLNFKFLIAFILGAITGSFANCCVWRMPRDESIIFPPSNCPQCRHKLGLPDLIPVLSYIFLKGRCRYCGGKISGRYLLIELLLGLLFMLVVYFFKNPGIIFINWALVTLLIIMTFIDWEHQLLPDILNYLVMLLGLIYQFSIYPAGLLTAVYAGVGAWFFMLALRIISGFIWHQETLGGGDIKLALALGLFFSWPKIVLVLFLSFFIGALYGLFLMIVKKKSRKDYMPFGPAMISSALISLFFGEKLISWYLKILLF